MNFHVGQKVVCVDDAGLGSEWGVHKDNIYTVTRSEVIWGVPMVDLAEAKLGISDFPSYFSSRFRPLIERKTDISIFTRMLREREVAS